MMQVVVEWSELQTFVAGQRAVESSDVFVLIPYIVQEVEGRPIRVDIAREKRFVSLFGSIPLFVFEHHSSLYAIIFKLKQCTLKKISGVNLVQISTRDSHSAKINVVEETKD